MGREESSAADNNSVIPQLNTFGFTRSGYYDYTNGSLSYQSSYGYYWSHTPDDKTYAYGLRFGSTSLYPRYSYYRGRGFPLRCLVR